MENFDHSTTLKTPEVSFSANGKHLKYKSFRKNDVIIWFSWPSFPQTQTQNDQWLLRCQISPGVDERHLIRFQSENAVFKFFQGSANGALMCGFYLSFWSCVILLNIG